VAHALRELTEAVEVLADEGRVVELAVRALHEVCPRGAAFGFTSRGEQAERMGAFRAFRAGLPVPVEPPHLAYVRTPAYDPAHVPPGQRNRWVEPFREGIASRESFRASTIYPLARRLGVFEQGRIVVCAGERQVAVVGAGVPEGTTFDDAERDALAAAAAALVVPLRLAALLAAGTVAPLEQVLAASGDAVLALDRRGRVVDSSRAGFELLRRDRALPDRVRAALRALERPLAVVRTADHVIHVSPCGLDGAAYLAVVDGAGFAEPPVALGARQTELLDLLGRATPNAELGAAMGIAPSTVKTMLERLYARAGVANRVELLSWWTARRR
jgi:DNA-binding CsgD family transcriptional regulator